MTCQAFRHGYGTKGPWRTTAPTGRRRPVAHLPNCWLRRRISLHINCLTSYRVVVGKCVAIHEERVVGVGDDVIQVALEAYRQYGYVPMYVSPVISPPVEKVRMTRYRLVP